MKNHLDEAIHYNLLRNYKRKMVTGRVILFLIASNYLIRGIYVLIRPVFIPMDIIIYGLFTLFYAILGFVSIKKPKIAFLVGLVTFASYLSGISLIVPESILDGIIFKVIILVVLTKGFINSLEIKKLEYKLQQAEIMNRKKV